MKILFVCTGNTCRSPMAESIFNAVCAEKDLEHTAFSRGTSVFFEEPINPKAFLALESLGIDAKSHTSAMISEDDVKNADLVLTMTSSQKMALKNKYQKYSSKIFTLNEKAYGKDFSVEDPFGQSEEVYLSCAKELKSAVEKLLEKL